MNINSDFIGKIIKKYLCRIFFLWLQKILFSRLTLLTKYYIIKEFEKRIFIGISLKIIQNKNVIQTKNNNL